MIRGIYAKAHERYLKNKIEERKTIIRNLLNEKALLSRYLSAFIRTQPNEMYKVAVVSGIKQLNDEIDGALIMMGYEWVPTNHVGTVLYK